MYTESDNPAFFLFPRSLGVLLLQKVVGLVASVHLDKENVFFFFIHESLNVTPQFRDTYSYSCEKYVKRICTFFCCIQILSLVFLKDFVVSYMVRDRDTYSYFCENYVTRICIHFLLLYLDIIISVLKRFCRKLYGKGS